MGSSGSGYLCSFLMNMGLVMFWVSLPYLAKDWFQAGPGLLGLIGGATGGAYVVTCLLAGKIARRLRRDRVMVLGALVSLGAALAAGFAPSVWFLVGIAVVGSVGNGLFWPALEARLSVGARSAELQHRMGWFNLSWSSGEMTGAVVGGVLYTLGKGLVGWTNFAYLQTLPFLVTVVLCVAVGLLAWKRLGDSASDDPPGDPETRELPPAPARPGAPLLPVFWTIALLANCAAAAFRGILINVFPDLGKGVLHYSALQWGVLFAMVPLSRTLMFLYWQRHRRWAYQAGYLFGFQALFPLAAVVLIFNSSYAVFLVVFLAIGVAMSKTYVASIYYGMDIDHSHQERGGVHEAALGSGNAVGTPLAGWFASASGWVRAPYLFAFVFLTAGILLQAWLYFAGKRVSRS